MAELNNKTMKLQDEGSWALMIEESNARAIQNYHGHMAGLDVDYYFSVGKKRWYKAYMEEDEILNNRKKMFAFLKNDDKYNKCIAEIYEIMDMMKTITMLYENKKLLEKFKTYCLVLCKYIAYYNSVIADTFYIDVYEEVDKCIPKNLLFGANAIKDSLFATDNNELLSHTQSVDILEMAEKYYAGEDIDEVVEEYVKKYKSTTSSSGRPNGITAKEVMDLIKNKTKEEMDLEHSFFNNLNLRYKNAERWSSYTAETTGIKDELLKVIRRTSQLSYLKIKMREVFQDFKIVTRENFLTELIKEIGKSSFDYMLIDEIEEFIVSGTKIRDELIKKRKESIFFEVNNDKLNVLYQKPKYIDIEENNKKDVLFGDVLIGTGIGKYRVRVINQDEDGLNDFNNYVEKTEDKENVAIITNVLRPFLVPQLRKFGVLLTQYGGYTSHASVLCREMGINSIVSVEGLMDSLQNDEYIEINYRKGEIKKINQYKTNMLKESALTIDLKTTTECSKSEVGNKAYNLIRINNIVNTPNGFVVSKEAMKRIDEVDVQIYIMEQIKLLNCNKIAIRSSHESEDGNRQTCAGLFESYVNVDAENIDEVIGCIKSVYSSQFAEHLDKYGVSKEGDMHVIIQEMISADISGVVLTSSPHNGVDYLFVEYGEGDLCHIMQGDITPFSAYVRKDDIFDDIKEYRSYPQIITKDIKEEFFLLLKYALKLEEIYMHRVEIEWGIRSGEIFIFQVRMY